MITKKDLEEYEYIEKEIEYFQYKIDNYKPAEIVVDSVRGSSSSFPFTERHFTIEGLEHKESGLDKYYSKLEQFKNKLIAKNNELEDEIQNIDSSEIRSIIRFRYFEHLSWVQIQIRMEYNSVDTPRKKLDKFFGE